jgi:RNase P/RNase MRP subunit POP5
MSDNEIEADPRDKWTAFHFSLSNPTGVDQGDVARLLRASADQLDALGDVQVADIIFTSAPTEGEDDLSLTIYYHRKPRRR